MSQKEKNHLNVDSKKTSYQTSHCLWNPIQLSRTQLKKGTVTLEGQAGNVSVAKQSQTAGHQRCLAGLVKTSRLPTAMQSKMTTKSLAVQRRGASSSLIYPGRGLFKSMVYCWQMCKQTAHISAHNPQPPASSSSGLEGAKPCFPSQDKQIQCTRVGQDCQMYVEQT